MLTHNLNDFLDLQGSCDQNKNKANKKLLSKCDLRLLLEWLVLAVKSFEDIFLEGTKNVNFVLIFGGF